MSGSPKTSPSSLEPGAAVGKFRLERLLGKGGCGDVWLARNTFALPGEDEHVALKIPHRQAADHLRLLAEPKLLKNLAHPNIVRVFLADKSAGMFYVAMEYMPGGNLREVLQREVRFSAQRVVSLARQVLQGLAHAHHARVVHRDVKPDNVFFDATGTAKIGDFGIAREVEANGQAMGTGGSRAYKAPEQLQGVATPASDVWALGLTLYEAVTGRYPFVPTRTETLETAICHRDVPPLPAWDEASALLGRLLPRCLQRDPGARFADATVLLAALEAPAA